MNRRLAQGAAALTVTISALAVAAPPASARPKPNATRIFCNKLTGASLATPPGLPLDGTVLKRATLAGTLTATQCTVTGGINLGEAISSIKLTTVTKYRNLSIADLAPKPVGAVVSVAKLTLSFRNAAGGQVCSNTAKAGTGSASPSTFMAPVSSLLAGGKALGGKCFKGKSVQMLHAGGPVITPHYITGLTVDETNGMDPPLRSSLTIQ